MARNDRVVLIVLLALFLAVAVVGAVLRGAGHGPELLPRRTSYSSGPSGLKALYLGLQQMGFSPLRLREPYDRLPEADALIAALSTAPVKLEPAEWEALAEWLRPGRVAVIAYEDLSEAPEMGAPSAPRPSPRGGFSASVPDAHVSANIALPTALTAQAPVVNVSGTHRISYPDADPSWEDLCAGGPSEEPPPAEAPSPARAGRPRAAANEDQGGRPPDRLFAAAVPLYDAEGPVVSVARVGRGTVLLLATPWTLCNHGIGQADNFALIVGFLDTYARGRTVVFDEYHHSFGRRRGLWSVIPPAGRAALAHALGAAILLIVVAGRRLGPPVRLPHPVRTRAEYLTSMASILAAAGATDLAVQRLLAHFRARALRALHSPSVDEAVFLALADTLPAGMGSELRAALTRGRELAGAGRPPVPQVLEWARRTTELLNRMERVGHDNQ